MPVDQLPTLPDWLPPLDTGQPNAQDLNDLGTMPKANFAAANQIIPITYGRDRLFGQPFVVHVDEDAGYLYTAMSFCEGQIAGFEKIIVDSDDALTTTKAYVGIKNRGFETGDYEGWTTGGSPVSAVESRTGDYAGVVPVGGGGPNLISDFTPAPPEDTVMRFTGYMMRDPLDLPDANANIAVRWYDAAFAAVGVRDTGTTPTGFTNLAALGTVGWQECVTNVTVPATAVYYAFDFGESTGTTGLWFCDDAKTEVLMEDNPGLTGDAIEVVAYTGTQTQRFDSMLAEALPGYTDDLLGLAYIVMRCPKDSTRGFPRLEAIVQGRLVYDPRLDTTRTDITPNGSGAHRENDPTTWEFSQNPTLCFRDLVTNFTGWTILDQGVADNADENDTLISGVPRREIGLTMARANTVESWVKGFRTYMGAFLNWEGGKIRVIPNRPDVEAPGSIVLDATAGTWVNIGDQPELDVGTGDFTLEFTFKGTANAFIISKYATVGYTTYLDATGKLEVLINDGTTFRKFTSTETLWDNEWHTVSASVNRTSDELIVTLDGVVQTPVDISAVTGTLTNADSFRVGSSSTGTALWDGSIDEVRLWNDVRTPTEISNNRLQEITDPTLDASLVGYWKMNEGTAASVAVDSSASGNDGTLAGAAVFGFGNAQIIPDGVAMHIGVDDIVKDSLALSRRSLRSVPNSVAIDYQDASGTRWFTARTQADSVRVSGDLEARRLSRVSLPGIHNASQAEREAIERLNWYLTDLECTLTLFDEGWNLTHGSIVAVTHPIGLDAKLFRVRQTTAQSGRWTVDLVEYDPAIYSDSVVSDPTIPDTNLGDPLNPPTVTNLVLAEELFNYKTGTTGSRVRIMWDATNFPFLSQYQVEGYVNGAKVWQTTTAANNIVTPGVEEIVDTLGTPTDYEVRVYVQSPFATGAAAIDNVQIDGKFAIPGNPTGAVAVQTFADAIDLTWVAAVDIDIWRYEVRRGTTSDTWATATSLVFVDGLAFSDTGLALGTHRYFIKAIDSVKQESAVAAQVDVILGAPTVVSGLFGFEVASEVRLNWSAAGGFVERYRIAYSDYPIETFETTLDIVDTLRFNTKDVPEGTFTFKCYSRDKAGNESATAAEIVIEVTSDADAFLADTYDFSFRTTAEPDVVANGSLTNVVQWDVRLDNKTYYVTNMADAFAVTPTDFIASDPLANYHSTGASEWLSETKDFGLLLTGSWNLTHDTVALQGTIEIELELSADDITYVAFGGSAKGEFRYARVRISTDATPGTATSYVKTPLMNLKINVVPLEESGESVSSPNAGVGKTINLTREYTALKEITTQPKNTIGSGSAVTSIVDNIVIGANTAVKGDGTNYLDAGDVLDTTWGSTDSFTVEFLAKASNQAGADVVIVGKKSSVATGNGWVVYQNASAGILTFRFVNGSTVSHNSANTAFPNDGLFHHVAFTFNQSTNDMIIYIDGVKDGATRTVSLAGGLENANSLRTHADGSGGNVWLGAIDQLRIWDDIRTGTEILDNKDIALDMTVTQSNLVGYWLMDGAVGTTVLTTGGAVPDQTTNANDFDANASGLTYTDPGNSSLVQKINSFDVFIFDTFGQQLGEEFQWKWKAV